VAGIACDDQPGRKRKKAVEGIKDYYLRKAQSRSTMVSGSKSKARKGVCRRSSQIKAYSNEILPTLRP